jgi:hypothetical protein
MLIIEQLILCIIQQVVNPLFEPIIVDATVLYILDKFICDFKLDNTNINACRETRDKILRLQCDLILQPIFKNNVVRCLDIIIHLLERNAELEKQTQSVQFSFAEKIPPIVFSVSFSKP